MSAVTTKTLGVMADPQIKDGSKLCFVEFMEADTRVKVRAGVPVEFAKTLKQGAKGEAELETVEGRDGKDNWQKVKSWNGQPTEPPRQGYNKGGGGGGGFKPTRTPEETASIMAQTVAVQAANIYGQILSARTMQDPKSAFNANEYAQIAKGVQEAVLGAYVDMLKKVKGS